MAGIGRKRTGDGTTPAIEGELVPDRLAERDEPAVREGADDAVEMAEDDEADEDEADEDEDDEDADEDEDDDEDEDEDEEDTESDR
jgi:segregation and condensation protein B